LSLASSGEPEPHLNHRQRSSLLIRLPPARIIGRKQCRARAAPKLASNCLPTGKWSVKFTNGVIETCEIRKDESISVVERRRSAGGRAAKRDGSVVIVCDNDQVECWTAAGQRMVVEHWFPAAQFPAGTPVLGIAERASDASIGPRRRQRLGGRSDSGQNIDMCQRRLRDRRRTPAGAADDAHENGTVIGRPGESQ
jgi:hypothetical protein